MPCRVPPERGKHQEQQGPAQVRSSANAVCSGNGFCRQKNSFYWISAVGGELTWCSRETGPLSAFPGVVNTNGNLAASVQGGTCLWHYLPGTIALKTRLAIVACCGTSDLWSAGGGGEMTVLCSVAVWAARRDKLEKGRGRRRRRKDSARRTQ